MKGKWGLHTITFILVMVGGLNWGLALFNWDIAHWLPMGLVKVIYALVALSALYEIFTHGRRCRECKPDGMAKM
jgi:uncharacterized membrane protein YuzA (DUF378 family)